MNAPGHLAAIASAAKSGADHPASFEEFLGEFAAAFARCGAPDLDAEIPRWLHRLVEFFGADRASLGEFTPEGRLLLTHSWARPGYELATGVLEQEIPYLTSRLRGGEMFAFAHPDEIPPEATHERQMARRVGIKSHVSVPLVLSGKAFGGLGIACIQRARPWPPDVMRRLRIIGTVLANALARKRAVQEYIRVSRALEHAGRVGAMGQLATSFAHEIKQPLAASLVNAEAALQLLEARPPDLAEVRAALHDIAADNQRAGDIVDHLRRFLRKQELALESIDVRELLEAVVGFVGPEARAKGVELLAEVAEALPRVLADRVQVQQVLVNLILNAFDAVSTVTAGSQRVRIEARASGRDRVAVSVVDSGPGVPVPHQRGLFEPFVTTKPEGLGIGLAIAQAIATAHGGPLAYSDAPQGGAVFAFSLAVAPA